MADEVLAAMANEKGIEFTGGSTEIKSPVIATDPLGNMSIVWEDVGVQVQVNQIERGRRTLDCYLSMRELSGKWISAPVRINLFSSSAKSQLRRDLNERKPLDWASRIDQVVVMVNETSANQREVKLLQRRTDIATQDWLAGPLLERNQHTMLVAEGGTGKSMIGLAICASLMIPRPLLPLAFSDLGGNVAYLDWETNDEIHERRLTQLVPTGASWPNIHYLRMSTPLRDDTQFLYEYFVRNHIRLAIYDSAGLATGGDMNTQQDAIAYVSAVRALGEHTALTITHPGWSDTKRSGGSRYFENAARAVWRAEKQQIEGELTSHIDFTNYKSNNGVIQKGFGLDVEFDAEHIRYLGAEMTEDKRDTPEQILRLLEETGPLSVGAIKEDLQHIAAGTIQTALTRMVTSNKLGRKGRGEYHLLQADTSNITVTSGGVEGVAPKGGQPTPVTNEPPARSYTLPYKDGEDELDV